MKVFIDFDDVLFNTKKFIEDMEVIFQKHGISKNIFMKHTKARIKFPKQIMEICFHIVHRLI